VSASEGPEPVIAEVQVGDLTLRYREAGTGPPVLLLHGWPTSSFLWREVMKPIGRSNRVLALDLPGFGGSSKPPDASYSFPFHEQAIDGFLAAVDAERISLAVHDLGGPIGVHWAIRNRERVDRLALLNTLLYARPSLAVVGFVVAARLPGTRHLLTSPRGLDFAMRLGMHRKERLTDEVREAVREPFATAEARRVLAKTGYGLSPKGFTEIQRALPDLTWPVRVIYGERDRVLPDVAKTMAKVKRDIPHAEVTALPDAGHFLQEDDPERVGALLAEFFSPT
jgi:pimeloyl-ACP methyl ester carboxylesterase